MAFAALLCATCLAACLTAYNRYKFTPLDDAPPLLARPEGCNVDVLEEGQALDRPHTDIGRIVLDFPEAKLKEQGPEGAIKTLKAAACENGAFFIKDLRALSTGTAKGLVYEAMLATLLGEDGKPVNLATDPAPAPTVDPNTIGTGSGKPRGVGGW